MSSPRPMRRSWPQRLTLALVIVTAIGCFAAAGALGAGHWVLSQRQLVTLADPSSQPGLGGSEGVVVPGASTTVAPAGDEVTTTTIFLAEPSAANFLVTGSDSGECTTAGDEIDPTIGDRSQLGERSDTIMILRANPDNDQLAVLSLPRDLYVDIAGGRKARINSAYRRDDPSRLIDTIYLNFGIPIDHYVQVDFCAFKRLVDAVGGITIPFAYPARDQRAGLDIPEAGCVKLDGEMALAYTRARHYKYEDPPGSGNWKQDPTSDFGRIARQQDFLRRVIAKVIDEGLYSPGVAGALIDTNREYLVTDTRLTVRRMLEFANTLKNLDPASITTYRIESSNRTIGGQSVEIPRLGGDNMKRILAVFRGEDALDDAPEQVFESTTTRGERTGDEDPAATATPTATTTTVAEVGVEENTIGLVPDRDASCP